MLDTCFKAPLSVYLTLLFSWQGGAMSDRVVSRVEMGKYPHSPRQLWSDWNCQSTGGDRVWGTESERQREDTILSLSPASPPSTSERFLACWGSGEVDRWNNWEWLPALANRQKLPPNVQYETQITTEEWEEEEGEEELCARQDVFMLGIEEIRGSGKDDRGKCLEEHGRVEKSWVSLGAMGIEGVRLR